MHSDAVIVPGLVVGSKGPNTARAEKLSHTTALATGKHMNSDAIITACL